ncbi:MAG TPA: EAL domain-containing protein [Kineosporiaceae bacterium]|nr:EAL domain-containing protein [Kineosporiaceae bacterium]
MTSRGPQGRTAAGSKSAGLKPEALRLLGFAAAVVAWALATTVTGFGPEQTVAWAAPAGWATAMLVRVRRGLRPVYAVVLLLITVRLRLVWGQPADLAVAHGVANACQALVFTWLTSRLCPDMVQLDRLSRAGQLLGLSAVASAAGGAVFTLGLVVELLVGPVITPVGPLTVHDTVMLGVVRAGAGLLGLLTLAPAVFRGARSLVVSLRRGPILAAIAVITLSLWAEVDTGISYLYLPLSLVLLAVGHAGLEAVALLPALVIPVTTWLTVAGHGPWGHAPLPYARPLAAQAYGLTVVTAALLIGALESERRGALDQLRTARDSLEAAVAERTRDLVLQSRLSATLAELGRALAQAPPAEQAVWETVATEVGRRIGDVCLVCHRDPTAGTLTALAVGGRDPQLVRMTAEAFGTPLIKPIAPDGPGPPDGSPGGPGPVARAISAGVPIRHEGTPAELARAAPPQLRDFVRRTGLHALAVVPLQDRGEGDPGQGRTGLAPVTLSLHRHGTPGGYGPAELEFLEEVAARATLAVTTARLHARAEALAGRLQGLMDAAVAGIFVVEGDHVVEANDAFLSLAGWDRTALEAKQLRWPQVAPDWARGGQRARLNSQGRVLPHEVTLRRQDGSVVPLLLAGARLGERPPCWIGLALDRSQAWAAQQATARRAVHAEILAECSRQAQDTGTLCPAALRHIAREVATRLGGGLAILLDREGQVEVAGVAHHDPAVEALHSRLLAQAPPDSSQGAMGRVLATGEPMLTTLGSAQDIPGWAAPDWASYLERVGGSAAAYLPLSARGKVLGVVYAQRSPAFRPDEYAFLRDLAERLALALDNDRLQQAERQARADLAGSEERYHCALDGMVDPVMTMAPVRDRTGAETGFQVSYVNAAHLAAGGPSPGTRHDQLGIGSDLPHLVRRLTEVLSSGEALRWDRHPWRGAHARGESRYVDVSLVRVGSEVMVSWRDVSDQVNAEVQLADSEERLRLAFDESPMAAALVSLEPAGLGRFLKVNRALCELTGHPEDQLVDTEASLLVHPQDRPADRRALAELAELADSPQGRFRQERRLLRADGRPLWALVTAATIRRDGHPWYAIEHIEDITDRKRAEQELVHRALYDPLTGLGNRHLLMDRLSVALKELSRGNGVVAVLYLDLDRFKEINDTLGHDAGDETIRQVGARLTATVRAPDTAARIGGDEFVVVSAHLTDEADATPIAERLQTALAEPVVLDGQQIRTRASIGVVTTRSSTTDPAELLHRADLAMYQAKQHGPGNTAVYSRTLRDPARRRHRVGRDLRAALEHDWLRLHYQPIVDLTDGGIVAAEALLRIDHPDRGLLLPEEFIDVAEDSDLILPIGGWVLTQAADRLAAWRVKHPELTLAVNVSARQLRRPGLCQQVVTAVEAASTDPGGLSVEMTERALFDAEPSVVQDLDRLVELGVRIALDDFGTGYSSLTNLKHLPVHTVKIDRSFIAGLDRHPDDTAIVQAVTALAGALNLNTVAEGVEHPSQVVALRRLGCRQAQGFHLGPPLPGHRFADLLDRGVGPLT